MMKVAVVGAGIAGLNVAYQLAYRGHEVTIFEAERYSAMKASFANGGQLSASNAEVWNTWPTVFRGLKWMFKKDAPLLIKPSLEWNKIKWITQFLWHTANIHRRDPESLLGQTHYENRIDELTFQAEMSQDGYKRIAAEESFEFDFKECGILHIYKDEKYWQAAQKLRPIYDDCGVDWDLLYKVQDIVALEPTLQDAQGIVGGAFTGSDAVGDIHLFCTRLTEILKTKYGVHFYYNYKIKDLKSLTDFDATVVSAGAESVRLAKTVGDTLAMYPVKGYSITIHGNSEEMLPKTSLIDDQAKIVTSTLGNRFRVAGTAELSGYNYDIRKDRIDPLLRWVKNNFPEIDTRDYQPWACLRPMTPDMMPIVGQSKKNEKVYYHTGHGHLGWTTSLETAKDIVRLIEDDHGEEI